MRYVMPIIKHPLTVTTEELTKIINDACSSAPFRRYLCRCLVQRVDEFRKLLNQKKYIFGAYILCRDIHMCGY
ncbi:unnamed protein product [Bursaphelenchus xylophilus]|uniref:(pine wood nematode) hypothetical protein n=1 Tax=Bursaphelenchus xylophilus TaxID=6326 RepID=A0A1I7S8G2_BURXY|nr:unnamed protein product [Bursaphelenchus xylophilus]CAG9121056.1 unnamed protein product [Bursaphelenchus xylophilus]